MRADPWGSFLGTVQVWGRCAETCGAAVTAQGQNGCPCDGRLSVHPAAHPTLARHSRDPTLRLPPTSTVAVGLRDKHDGTPPPRPLRRDANAGEATRGKFAVSYLVMPLRT